MRRRFGQSDVKRVHLRRMAQLVPESPGTSHWLIKAGADIIVADYRELGELVTMGLTNLRSARQ